jgi:hypothetical protein
LFSDPWWLYRLQIKSVQLVIILQVTYMQRVDIEIICFRIALNIYRLEKCRIWGSHSGGYEDYCLLGCNAMQSSAEHIVSIIRVE